MLLSNAIVIDFDGFLVEHSFPEIGQLKEGDREFLEGLRADGYKIIINSCRNNKELRATDLHPVTGETLKQKRDYLEEIRTFLVMENLPYDWLDDGENGKPIGRAYCDDRNVPFYDSDDHRRDFEKMRKYIQKRFPTASFKREF